MLLRGAVSKNLRKGLGAKLNFLKLKGKTQTGLYANERENYILLPIFSHRIWECVCIRLRCESKVSMGKFPSSEVSNARAAAACSGIIESLGPYKRR